MVRARGDTLALDEAILSALGLDLHAEGALRGDRLTGHAELDLPDARLFDRLPAAPDSVDPRRAARGRRDRRSHAPGDRRPA